MIKFIYEQDVNIDVENPGILEVPEGKNVEDLPIKHFVDLANKKGLSTITKALNNLQVWNKNKNPKLSKWAGDMIDKVSKRVDNQKNESLSIKESSIPKWQDDLMREVYEELRKNHLGGDIYDDYNFRGSDALLVMCIEIEWGDWKHDHLATDWIVSEVIDRYDNLKLVKKTTETTEEDGSDTYSAIHRYLITKEDDTIDDMSDDIIN